VFGEHGDCSAHVFGCSRKCARENREKESSLQTRNMAQVDSALSNATIRELCVGCGQARICCSPGCPYPAPGSLRECPCSFRVLRLVGAGHRLPAARMLQEML